MIANVAAATAYIQWLHDGEPFEACIIGPEKPTGPQWKGRANGKGIVAGWFTDPERAAQLVFNCIN